VRLCSEGLSGGATSVPRLCAAHPRLVIYQRARRICIILFSKRLSVDASANVYVAGLVTNLIRKVTPAGVVTKLAGGGSAETEQVLLHLLILRLVWLLKQKQYLRGRFK